MAYFATVAIVVLDPKRVDLSVPTVEDEIPYRCGGVVHIAGCLIRRISIRFTAVRSLAMSQVDRERQNEENSNSFLWSSAIQHS